MRARRVEARGQQDRGRVVGALAQLSGVVGDGDRVQVDDAEDPSPCSWAATYWEIAPIWLPRCLRPVGWIPEKLRTAAPPR